MKIKTDFVPEYSSSYLTAGREYKVVSSCGSHLADILDNDGDRITINLNSSSHIGGTHWQIVEPVVAAEPFNITKHEFGSLIRSCDNVDDDGDIFLRLKFGVTGTYLRKEDVIALAKAIGVTGDDL
jgi:hypothetical protein